MSETVIVAALGTVALAAVSFIQARDRAGERASAAAERSQLLDRFMARDFREYVASTSRAGSPVPQVTDDEAETKYAEAQGL